MDGEDIITDAGAINALTECIIQLAAVRDAQDELISYLLDTLVQLPPLKKPNTTTTTVSFVHLLEKVAEAKKTLRKATQEKFETLIVKLLEK